MFRLDYRKEEIRRVQKELMNNVKIGEKPKLKDLVSIMIAQYLIILPVAFIGMIVFYFVIWGILYLWGA